MKYALFLMCICLSLTACFENKKDKEFINEKITQFLDMDKIAQGTSRIALAVPLSKMQEYQGELKRLKVSSPCKKIQEQSIHEMDTILTAYVSFLSGKNDVGSLALANIAEANLSDIIKFKNCSEYNKEISRREKRQKEREAKNKNFNNKEWWAKATAQDVSTEIKKGADIYTENNEEKFSPIKMALKYSSNQPEVIKVLVKNGVDIKGLNNTILHVAAKFSNNPEVIKTLVELGANVNARDKSNETPLHEAAKYNNNPEVIKTFVKLGANVNARDTINQTPLHEAAFFNRNTEIIRTLVELGASVNAKDNLDNTPQEWAKYNKNPDIVKIFTELSKKTRI